MGIDSTALETILVSLPHVNKKGRMLTLARQGIHIPKDKCDKLLSKHNINLIDYYDKYCEIFFRKIGFNCVDSIDYSDYENATIIYNMNIQVPIHLHGKYNYIYDGGTTEHIFNIPQVYENIFNMLCVDGIYCSVTVNNNFSGHGMYQFSPEFFQSVCQAKYGMEIINIYLGKVNTPFEEWHSVKDAKSFIDGRNTFKFDLDTPVYILTIAKKVTENRFSLTKNPPNQYSYEHIEWKK